MNRYHNEHEDGSFLVGLLMAAAVMGWIWWHIFHK